MDFYKKWWFYVALILVIAIIFFLYPKECGTGWKEYQKKNCECSGIKLFEDDWETTAYCIGICRENCVVEYDPKIYGDRNRTS